MKTLILEPDPARARAWIARYGGDEGRCDLARSPAQARLMLIGQSYDRFCLRFGTLMGASHSLLSVARATNPECEIVDLASKTRRPVSGPSLGAVLRQEAPDRLSA
ncbi:hypothetical protein HKCCE2091_09570 [Rhodobacterales bacterium HKCCE2091]|nr:hypothetical protein [Rhodobacterales bacterium HKCCE2091]